MIVGILKEIKTEENRVCMTPAGVEIMKAHGHDILVEGSAGDGSGFSDENYVVAGAEIVKQPEDIFRRADDENDQDGDLPAHNLTLRATAHGADRVRTT